MFEPKLMNLLNDLKQYKSEIVELKFKENKSEVEKRLLVVLVMQKEYVIKDIINFLK